MWKVASIHIGKPLKWQICGVWKNVVDCRPWFNLEFWQPVCVEWKQKKKVVCPAIFILRGMGVAWQRWGQRCVSCLCGARGPGPSGARPYLGECFMERTIGSGLVRMRCQDNCNWSALLKKKKFVYVLQCRLVQSVCFWLCVRVCGSFFFCVLTEALHKICPLPFGNTSLWGREEKNQSFYSFSCSTSTTV